MPAPSSSSCPTATVAIGRLPSSRLTYLAVVARDSIRNALGCHGTSMVPLLGLVTGAG